MDKVRLWPPNSLPIPFFSQMVSEKAEVPAAQPEIDVNDNFPKGQIHRYFPYQGHGYIRDRAGREIYFNLLELEFVGFGGKDSLREGAAIGYDVARTGTRLHVRKMKIY